MTVKIRLFASLREKLGCSELTLDEATANTVADVRKSLTERGEAWSALLEEDVHAAVNQQMVDENHPVAAGDEVAFFPPVTGG